MHVYRQCRCAGECAAAHWPGGAIERTATHTPNRGYTERANATAHGCASVLHICASAQTRHSCADEQVSHEVHMRCVCVCSSMDLLAMQRTINSTQRHGSLPLANGELVPPTGPGETARAAACFSCGHPDAVALPTTLPPILGAPHSNNR
jgi:hypothetical protein